MSGLCQGIWPADGRTARGGASAEPCWRLRRKNWRSWPWWIGRSGRKFKQREECAATSATLQQKIGKRIERYAKHTIIPIARRFWKRKGHAMRPGGRRRERISLRRRNRPNRKTAVPNDIGNGGSENNPNSIIIEKGVKVKCWSILKLPEP